VWGLLDLDICAKRQLPQSISQRISIIPDVQNRDDREFRLQWTWDVHRPRYFEEHVQSVVDLVRFGFAVRALLEPNGEGAGSRSCDTCDLHTRLYELGIEGQLRHWYLMPMIG
jgi:hypothetical protein